MTKQKILNLLDMSETEAYAILHENEITSFDQDNSLPDLAFRLRDEVPKEKYLDSLNDIRRHYQRQKKPYTFIDAYKFVVGLTSIEMVCTALLAGLENK